ncbi:MAG: hypothetical protein WBX25_02210 [Rhodomicrobium sp.]
MAALLQHPCFSALDLDRLPGSEGIERLSSGGRRDLLLSHFLIEIARHPLGNIFRNKGIFQEGMHAD